MIQKNKNNFLENTSTHYKEFLGVDILQYLPNLTAFQPPQIPPPGGPTHARTKTS
jgi:hypothetical protein